MGLAWLVSALCLCCSTDGSLHFSSFLVVARRHYRYTYVIAMSRSLLFDYTVNESHNVNLLSKVLNPSICLSWIQHKWSSSYIQRSKKIMLDLVSAWPVSHILVLMICPICAGIVKKTPSVMQPNQVKLTPSFHCMQSHWHSSDLRITPYTPYSIVKNQQGSETNSESTSPLHWHQTIPASWSTGR